jgi:hypothetical protein
MDMTFQDVLDVTLAGQAKRHALPHGAAVDPEIGVRARSTRFLVFISSPRGSCHRVPPFFFVDCAKQATLPGRYPFPAGYPA